MMKKLDKYLKGKGVNTSSKKALGEKRIDHFYQEPSGLYSLKDKYKIESLDFIYSKNLINATKYYRILLKEWFNFLKVDGFLIIDFKENEILDMTKLRIETIALFKDKAIIADRINNEILVIQKKKTVKIPEDSIDKWTIGVITNGKRNDVVEKFIASVRRQKIPYYEIIVCGSYFDRKEKDFRYLPFREHDDLGWITRKKNIICENARYENIMVLHDRFILNDDWFKGMKKYGNQFEILSCPQITPDGIRAGDWVAMPGQLYPLKAYYRLYLLDYDDWDENVFVVAGPIILKKSVWGEIKWDESQFWSLGAIEDAIFAYEASAKGFVTRFNSYSKLLSLFWRNAVYPRIKKDNLRLGKPYGSQVRRSFWFLMRVLAKFGLAEKMGKFWLKLESKFTLLRKFREAVGRQ